ncbi:MAG: primosomal protein N' [Proteobacteria bacterium]|nr:primosomal protein N' [Pseudomonadota bacterium]
MGTKQQIFQVALDVPLRRLFDYLSPCEEVSLCRGMRVKVPFGRQSRIGIILNQTDTSCVPANQLKAISQLCDTEALFPLSLCDFIVKTAAYYHHPIGEVAFSGLPRGIKLGKPINFPVDETSYLVDEIEHHALQLNLDQQKALDAIVLKQSSFQVFLLEGITGSGKTEIYLQAASHLLLKQKQVLVLVPEISLTPQTQDRFKARFGQEVICFHSKMTSKQRLEAWLKVRHHKAAIVIGTRSSIFLPFSNLGMIIIDEEHDPSFKQQEGFRYSARDLGVLRAKMANCPIILGSATPSFESIFNAKNGKYQELHLTKRATNTALASMTLLDIRHNKLEAGLSKVLLKEIEQNLKQDKQVLLFINRRGYAPIYLCYDCSWIAQCDHCDARLTYHHKKQVLICHHCLKQRSLPLNCPACHQAQLNPVGQGTEKLEAFLQVHFPHTVIARIDSDVTGKKGHLESLLSKAKNKEAQLLIGTQILAKGHHFPHLGMVAVVDADGGLFSVDFRSVERMAQLLIQVAGRAGRVHEAGKVFIQTFHPQHPLLQSILHQNYLKLAEQLLQERQAYHLPPYTYFALIRAQGPKKQMAESLLTQIQQQLQKQQNKAITISGPVPAPMLKRQGLYRYQLLLQAKERKPLHQMLSYSTAILENSKLAKKVHWSLDVDPIEMF